jgi:hypothetical protein
MQLDGFLLAEAIGRVVDGEGFLLSVGAVLPIGRCGGALGGDESAAAGFYSASMGPGGRGPDG